MSTEKDAIQVTTIVDRSRLALQDDFLRGAVRFTTERLRGRKAASSEELGNWEAWRERGRQIRSHTIAHLDYYLRQFVDNVQAHGGHVYFAANAEEAAQTIVKIVEKKQAKLAVKSKSMVSEEIHINKHLQERGIEVVETDLGEYIIQLAGEMPSHIIIPAIHKTRSQIKDLFTAAGATNLTTDTKDLTAFARRALRDKFLRADVGMTGCNFAIAESGSVVLFTNEGNGRMVSTLPKTHIVTMGMERILPTFARSRSDGEPPAEECDGTKAHHVHQRHYGTAQGGGGGWSGRVAHCHFGQRALVAARRRRVPGGLALHSLWGVFKRLPGLPPHWRPRVRECLSGADWRGVDTAVESGRGLSEIYRTRPACAAPATRLVP